MLNSQTTIAEIGEERRERFRANAQRNWMRVLKPQSLLELELDPEEEDAVCEK